VTEVPLEGGVANRGLVMRVGDTVRRPQRPTSAATQAAWRSIGRDAASASAMEPSTSSSAAATATRR
jgi:hypothetical protein